MIDVLLVLIIIFLVITPIQSRGLAALVPQPATETTPDPPHPIVITVLADGQVSLNQELLELPQLEHRLADLFKTRAVRVVFLRADKGLEFREVARVIDIAKGAGAGPIGLMTR
jgi:biopolymer transport protein ExbD